MTSVSGTLAYEDIKETIEALVYIEGRKHPIPGMATEDIAQEIRLECLRVLPYYDAARIGPSPYKFLQICIRNFLYNQRRGTWVPNNPPCVRCPLWNREKRICTIDEVGCEPIVRYRKNMKIKADLKQPSSLEIDISDNSSQEQDLDAILLDRSIRDALSPKLLKSYDKMLAGEKLSPRIKQQIREIALDIIKNAEQ